MPENPTQADLGAHVYYLNCMTCHGDRGQGLTDEWRAAWGTSEQNCWQAKCHAANHPPEGFELPRYAPPLIGTGTLGQFQHVGELHQYAQDRMPWHAPGTLSEEEYWQLAAFLAEANGVQDVPAEPAWDRLAQLPLRPQVSQTDQTVALPGWLAWLAGLGGVGIVLRVAHQIWLGYRRPTP